jgi:hypothetical protein
MSGNIVHLGQLDDDGSSTGDPVAGWLGSQTIWPGLPNWAVSGIGALLLMKISHFFGGHQISGPRVSVSGVKVRSLKSRGRSKR